MTNAGFDSDAGERFIRSRCSKATDVYIFDRAYAPSPASHNGWTDQGLGYTRESNYCLATDGNGVPVFIEPTYDIILDKRKIADLSGRLSGYGCGRTIMVLESDSGSADDLLSNIGSCFVIPARRKTPFVKNMMTQLVRRRTEQRAIRHFDGRTFTVYESEIAIVPRSTNRRIENRTEDNETPQYEIVMPDDQRFFSEPLESRLSAWACVSAGPASDDGRERMMNLLSGIEERLMSMDPFDAVDRLNDIAGEYGRYLDVKVVEGELQIKIRQKGVSAALNREGIFVLLSHGLRNWNDVMACYRCRELFQNSLGVMSTNLTPTTLPGNQLSLLDRMMVQFVALILWKTCEKRLMESGVDLPVSTVMQILDAVIAIGNGTEWEIPELDDRQRRMLSALNVMEPDRHLHAGIREYPQISGRADMDGEKPQDEDRT